LASTPIARSALRHSWLRAEKALIVQTPVNQIDNFAAEPRGLYGEIDVPIAPVNTE
jgi:hypothetical protein